MSRRTAGVGVAVLVVLAAYLVGGMLAPAWLPAHDWHPRSLFWQIKEYPVNPWVPVEREPLELELWTVALPLEVRQGVDDARHMEYALQQFQQAHPQVTVSHQTMAPDAFHDALLAAYEENSFPHVIAGPLALIPPHLPLVPLRPFVIDEGAPLPEHHLALVSNALGDHRVWPRWYETTHWLASGAALRDAGVPVEEIQASGWSWQAAAAAMEQLAAAGYQPLVLRKDPARAVLEMAAAAGAAPTPAAGTQEDAGGGLEELLEHITRLRHGAYLEEDTVQTALRDFWQGRTAILLPAGSGMHRHAAQRLHQLEQEMVRAGSEVEPVLLPLPHLGDGGRFPVHPDVAAVPLPELGGVPSQSPLRGELRLAVSLARFLTQPPALWPAEALGAVPAHPDAAADWHQAVQLPSGQADVLLGAAADNLTLAPRLAHPYRSGHFKDEGARRLWALLQDWWNGEVNQEELLRRWHSDGGNAPAEP